MAAQERLCESESAGGEERAEVATCGGSGREEAGTRRREVPDQIVTKIQWRTA